MLIRNITYSIGNVSYHCLAREKGHFKGLKSGGIFSNQKGKLYRLKSFNRKWYDFFILFVLVDATLLSLDLLNFQSLEF